MTVSPHSQSAPIRGQRTNEELARCVRMWRERLNPDDMPEIHARRARRPRRRLVSQTQVAMMIGCSTQWYSQLELGHLQNYSDDFLQRVVQVLKLDTDDMTLLFLLVGREPRKITARVDLLGLERLLDAQPWPAYLRDEAWDLVGCNRYAHDLFSGCRSGRINVMQWALTNPDARRYLHQWDTAWAPWLLAKLRTTQLRYPGNRRIGEVVTEILAVNTDARRLWASPLTSLRPMVAEISLKLPSEFKPHPIHVVTLEPHLAPGHRLTVLIPAVPTGCQNAASSAIPAPAKNGLHSIRRTVASLNDR